MRRIRHKGRIVAAALLTFSITCLAGTQSDSLFTMPIISVSPGHIDFGAVASKASVTNTVVVENWGGGKLVGKATVPRPFKILSGASYKLSPGDAQVVTISYTPSNSEADTNVLKFTGGGGKLVPVTGRLLPGKER